MKERGFEVVRAYAGSGVHLPQRKTAASAGYDIEAAADAILAPGRMTLVPTGLKAYMRPDEVLLLHVRSSLAVKRQVALMNGVGVIDADYYDNPANEGHILVALFNHGDASVAIKKGERICQGIFVKYRTADDDAPGEGELRQGGFGSTGTD